MQKLWSVCWLPDDLQRTSARGRIMARKPATEAASRGRGKSNGAPPGRLSRPRSIVAATARCAAEQRGKAPREGSASLIPPGPRAAAAECPPLIWVRSTWLLHVVARRNVYQNPHKVGISVTEALR